MRAILGIDGAWTDRGPSGRRPLSRRLWSTNAASTPFGGGTLCVAAPTVRTPAQFSNGSPVGDDCTGVYSFHFSQAYMGSQSLASGTTLRAQYWSRDNGFAAPNNMGLTAEIRFTLHP